MIKHNYTLPFSFKQFFENGCTFLNICDEINSIDTNISLLLFTGEREHRFNESFGAGIWDMDFDRIGIGEKWEVIFRERIFASVAKYEKRIKEVKVEVYISDYIQDEGFIKNRSVKKRLDIYVFGKLKSTEKKVGFRYTLYLGPISGG